MNSKKRYLRLNSIVAFLQSETDGDEIFITYNDEKVAPTNAKFVRMSNDPTPLNTEIELAESDNWVELELWDYDRFSPNDSLGKFKLLVDQTGDGFTAELSRKGDASVRYVLNWSLIERKIKV